MTEAQDIMRESRMRGLEYLEEVQKMPVNVQMYILAMIRGAIGMYKLQQIGMDAAEERG